MLAEKNISVQELLADNTPSDIRIVYSITCALCSIAVCHLTTSSLPSFELQRHNYFTSFCRICVYSYSDRSINHSFQSILWVQVISSMSITSQISIFFNPSSHLKSTVGFLEPSTCIKTLKTFLKHCSGILFQEFFRGEFTDEASLEAGRSDAIRYPSTFSTLKSAITIPGA